MENSTRNHNTILEESRSVPNLTDTDAERAASLRRGRWQDSLLLLFGHPSRRQWLSLEPRIKSASCQALTNRGIRQKKEELLGFSTSGAEEYSRRAK